MLRLAVGVPSWRLALLFASLWQLGCNGEDNANRAASPASSTTPSHETSTEGSSPTDTTSMAAATDGSTVVVVSSESQTVVSPSTAAPGSTNAVVSVDASLPSPLDAGTSLVDTAPTTAPPDTSSRETGQAETEPEDTGVQLDPLEQTDITSSGLTVVSYGGYLNGESFQQDGIVTYNGYQYAAFWNTARHVVLARRATAGGDWNSLEFDDYSNSEDDAHNTISLGVAPGDGSLHLAFDHHDSDLHYRKSVPGLLTDPETVDWATASFGAVTASLVDATRVTMLTYPRFVTKPDGNLLLSARIGASGGGDELLWEYDTTNHTWLSLGRYIAGLADSANAYLHGLAYTPLGTRLHAAWCWRETPDATTNHDLYYVFSDDHGRSWKANDGSALSTTGSTDIKKSTAAAKVWSIGQNRGLINQEHMAVDRAGVVHVLGSHLPNQLGDNSDFTAARKQSEFFHYWRGSDGTWHRAELKLKVVENFRGKLAISSHNNVYAILPNLRIAAASARADYTDWALIDDADQGRFFSDPLIDTARLEQDDHLTVFYPRPASGIISALDYALR